MVIYGALFIPFIAAFILYRYFRRETVWWELFLPLLVTLIFTFSMKFLIEKVQVSSKEYWGSMVDKIEYYQPWDEWIVETCTTTCCCDDKGSNCSTITYDCSHSVYHDAEWRIVTTTNEIIKISQSRYNALKSKLGNEKFVELNRDFYTIDGNEYCCQWQKDSANAEPVTTLHHYENRIKSADQSVFHFDNVSDADVKKYALKQYPSITEGYKMAAVIGDSSADALEADKKLQYFNGLLGHKKEMRAFVLVFKDQPVIAASYQEWYWSGGNMNEFVICIGIDGQRNVKWCKVISWTENETIKAEVKSFIQAQGKLELGKAVDYAAVKIDNGFVRKDFKQFDYLTVEPPMWAVLLTYILALIMNAGIAVWVIRNQYQD